MRRFRLAPLIALTLLMLLGGCGKGDLVTARGVITVDGQPASRGRLLLYPVGTGERADSLVAEDGAFLLRTKGVEGVKPGTYQVTFTRPLADEKNSNDRIGDLPPAEITVMYQSLPGSPIEIPTSDVTDLEIAIEAASGWTRKVND